MKTIKDLFLNSSS